MSEYGTTAKAVTARKRHRCSEYGTTAKAVTARKRHRCDAGYREVHVIAPGHRYMRHTVFPGHDANTSHRPYNVTECVACAENREQAAGLLAAGACATFCCRETPCALPFKHDDDHSCHRCAARPARATQ
jgi:hypothetical protein